MHAQEPGENQGIYGCAARRPQQQQALDPRDFPDCRRPIPAEDASMDDADLAASAARLAGKILLDLAQDVLWTGAARGRGADFISNELVLAAMERLEQPRLWIVDPLDATPDYAEGYGDWAVDVALAIRGKPTVGAVALPACGLLPRSAQELRGPLNHLAKAMTAPPLVQGAR
jgi:3'-phosphoadenosine 5'-phosphosulfate (PAPS) 3'-phosphatase